MATTFDVTHNKFQVSIVRNGIGHPTVHAKGLKAKIQSFHRANAEYRKACAAYKEIDHKADHLLDLVKKENDRDDRRDKQDRKDKSHDRWVKATYLTAAIAPFLVGGATVAGMQIGLNNPDDTPWLPWISALVGVAAGLTTATRGKGFFPMKVQEADYKEKNGGYHGNRRMRAYHVEAGAKIRFYENMVDIREQNDQLTLGQMYAWHKRRLKGKMKQLDKKKKKIDRKITEMEQRDEKVRMREHKDGHEPSYDWARRSAKLAARKCFEEFGIGEHFRYFADPEHDLPDKISASSEASKKDVLITTLKNTFNNTVDKLPIGKSIRQKLVQESKEKPKPEKTPLQRTCEAMRKELPDAPSWPGLSDKLAVELGRFRETINN